MNTLWRFADLLTIQFMVHRRPDNSMIHRIRKLNRGPNYGPSGVVLGAVSSSSQTTLAHFLGEESALDAESAEAFNLFPSASASAAVRSCASTLRITCLKRI